MLIFVIQNEMLYGRLYDQFLSLPKKTRPKMSRRCLVLQLLSIDSNSKRKIYEDFSGLFNKLIYILM